MNICTVLGFAQVKLQQRLALPFACLVFGMVGSLVSLNLRRDQKKVGVAIGGCVGTQ